MARGRQRANREGSIFPYRNGYAAYVWVVTPEGQRRRKWAYGKTREEVHAKWVKLHARARQGPTPTSTPTVERYLRYWLREVVEPHLAPKTSANYDMFIRLYIVPGLGRKRLDRLSVRDVQTWLNRLRETCQCCAQGKDTKRSGDEQRCCAVGRCCQQTASARTLRDAWTVLRSALNNAVREELVVKNVASLVRVPKPRKRKVKPWTAEEARSFLESAREGGDSLYAAYVLILVLGLRRGEALGLTWNDVDFDSAELYVRHQLQRVRGELLHRETKTESSDAPLPLPQICLTALRVRAYDQAKVRSGGGSKQDASPNLVFTTGNGFPVDPDNFKRSFANRCRKAGVRGIPMHTTRRTCASLLVALDIHPRVAMQVLRHSQIAVTMDVYSEVSSSDTRAALRRLGESLDD